MSKTISRAGGKVYTSRPRWAPDALSFLPRSAKRYFPDLSKGDIIHVHLLKGNLPSSTIHQLAKLNSASSVYLGDVGLDNNHLRAMGQMTTLKEFWFGPANVDDQGFKYLSKSQSIKTLGLVQLDMSKVGMLHLKKLPRLSRLCIDEMLEIDQADLDALVLILPGITGLSLSRCDVTDSQIAQLQVATNLEELDIVRCDRITGEGLKSLVGLKNLEKIDLKGGQVDVKIIEEVQKRMPHCDIQGIRLN